MARDRPREVAPGGQSASGPAQHLVTRPMRQIIQYVRRGSPLLPPQAVESLQTASVT